MFYVFSDNEEACEFPKVFSALFQYFNSEYHYGRYFTAKK